MWLRGYEDIIHYHYQTQAKEPFLPNFLIHERGVNRTHGVDRGIVHVGVEAERDDPERHR